MDKTDAVRCRGCNREIWKRSEAALVSAHGLRLEEANEGGPCESWRRGQVFSEAEILPEWASCLVTASDWQSGKLICPCGIPLGSFDFVSGRKCPCGLFQLPPVRLNTKKIDLFVEPSSVPPVPDSNCDGL